MVADGGAAGRGIGGRGAGMLGTPGPAAGRGGAGNASRATRASGETGAPPGMGCDRRESVLVEGPAERAGLESEFRAARPEALWVVPMLVLNVRTPRADAVEQLAGAAEEELPQVFHAQAWRSRGNGFLPRSNGHGRRRTDRLMDYWTMRNRSVNNRTVNNRRSGGARLRRVLHCCFRFGRRGSARPALFLDKPALDLDRDGFVDRTGVGFLLSDAQLGEHVEDHVRFDLKLAGQLVNTNFHHTVCPAIQLRHRGCQIKPCSLSRDSAPAGTSATSIVTDCSCGSSAEEADSALATSPSPPDSNCP